MSHHTAVRRSNGTANIKAELTAFRTTHEPALWTALGATVPPAQHAADCSTKHSPHCTAVRYAHLSAFSRPERSTDDAAQHATNHLPQYPAVRCTHNSAVRTAK